MPVCFGLSLHQDMENRSIHEDGSFSNGLEVR